MGALIGLPAAWLAIARYLACFTSTARHALAAMRIRPALALRE